MFWYEKIIIFITPKLFSACTADVGHISILCSKRVGSPASNDLYLKLATPLFSFLSSFSAVSSSIEKKKKKTDY